MNTFNLVSVDDLRSAAGEVEQDIAVMQELGYPVIRTRSVPHLLRRAAVELEILKAELWRVSQGHHPG